MTSDFRRPRGHRDGVPRPGRDLVDGAPAPAGTYTLRLVLDNAGGDHDHAAPPETWTSPPVTVVR
ncbi:hypothetical protein [Streptomyces sp. R35]|uniref:Uncharacterized protein n=1 Tax=Streptomyces sp. R35 TaxID=3238630 RepID=A0AB39SEJ3_9ACTN